MIMMSLFSERTMLILMIMLTKDIFNTHYPDVYVGGRW